MSKAEEILWLLEKLSTNVSTGGAKSGTTASTGDTSGSNGQSGTNGSTSSETSDGEEENSSDNGETKNDDKKDTSSHRHPLHYAYGVRCNCDDPHGRKCLLYCKTRINRK